MDPITAMLLVAIGLAIGLLVGVALALGPAKEEAEIPHMPAQALPTLRQPITAKELVERKRQKPISTKRQSWTEVRAKLEQDLTEIEKSQRMEKAYQAHKEIL